MKTNAIIRLVAFSITLVLLNGLLLTGLSLKSYLDRKETITTWPPSHDADIAGSGTRGDISTVSSDIRNIEIKWVIGTITVQAGDVEQTTYQETAVSDSRYRMVSEVSAGELEIEYCSEDISLSFFGINDDAIEITKDLTITVPRGTSLDSLEIEAASAEVILRDLNVRKISLDTASGRCTLENCDIGELDIDTASGDISFTGSLDILDYDAASAKFIGILDVTPRKIDIDTLSGDVDLTLPSDAGFTVLMDAVSGHLTADFEMTISGVRYICGDGKCSIEFDGMSGDITLRKAG